MRRIVASTPMQTTELPSPRDVERRLAVVHRRVRSETPFSPAWDAAMAELEDAEREAWYLVNEPAPDPPAAGRRWAVVPARGW